MKSLSLKQGTKDPRKSKNIFLWVKENFFLTIKRAPNLTLPQHPSSADEQQLLCFKIVFYFIFLEK